MEDWRVVASDSFCLGEIILTLPPIVYPLDAKNTNQHTTLQESMINFDDIQMIEPRVVVTLNLYLHRIALIFESRIGPCRTDLVRFALCRRKCSEMQ